MGDGAHLAAPGEPIPMRSLLCGVTAPKLHLARGSDCGIRRLRSASVGRITRTALFVILACDHEISAASSKLEVFFFTLRTFEGSLRPSKLLFLSRGYMVGLRGFEPPTPCSRSRCATRLRYSPTVPRNYWLSASFASHTGTTPLTSWARGTGLARRFRTTNLRPHTSLLGGAFARSMSPELSSAASSVTSITTCSAGT